RPPRAVPRRAHHRHGSDGRARVPPPDPRAERGRPRARGVRTAAASRGIGCALASPIVDIPSVSCRAARGCVGAWALEGTTMDLQLAGKNAIVTGGSRGIGKAIALELA